MAKSNNVTKPYKRPINGRRKRALERLEKYLASGRYTNHGVVGKEFNESSKVRMKQEIETLRTRIVQ